MNLLSMPDRHYVSAAMGWMELGNCDEARAELGKISPELHSHPVVLQVRYEINVRAKDWSAAALTAVRMAELNPNDPQGWISLAYATRRKPEGGILAAKAILIEAQQKFPDETIIIYNLACYEAQLDDLPAARTWLKKAYESGGRKEIKQMALLDKDLEPLWPEIKSSKGI